MVSGQWSFDSHGKGSFKWHFSTKFQENHQGQGLVEGILIRKILNIFELDFEGVKEGIFEGNESESFEGALSELFEGAESRPFEGDHQPIRKKSI